jgi:hypothetical protein
MNIFILDENPFKAAEMHCDQHIHKMILESAQIVSTAAIERGYVEILPYLYQPAYEKHPCVVWASHSNHAIHWICCLAEKLEEIRLNNDCSKHASIDVIRVVANYLDENFPYASYKAVETFAEAMPAFIKIRNDLTTVQKYQMYYRYKHRQWLDKRSRMSYNYNPVPEFMKDLFP